MKAFIPVLFLAAWLAGPAFALDRIPAEEVNGPLVQPRRGLVTPHCEWEKELPETEHLKVLFLVPSAGFRDVLELEERSLIRPVIYGFKNAKKWEREQELLGKIREKYHAVVLGNVDFMSLPAEARFRILSAVRDEGTGLLFVGSQALPPYRKAFAEPLSASLLENFRAPLTDKGLLPAKCLRAWRLGKGVVMDLRFPVRVGWAYTTGDSLHPDTAQDHTFEALHENAMGLLIRAIRFSASSGREPAWTARPENGKIRFEGKRTLPLAVRIRDVWNKLRSSAEIPPEITEWPLHELPGGVYFCDLVEKGGTETANLSVAVSGAAGPMVISPEKTVVKDQGPIRGTVSWEKPQEEECVLVLSLADSPDFKVWTKRSFPVEKGAVSFRFELTGYRHPTVAAFLHAELFRKNGSPLAETETTLLIPKSRLSPDDYLQIGWGCAPNLILARQINRLVGWQGALLHPNEASGELPLFNQRIVPYMVRICLLKGAAGEVSSKWIFSDSSLRKELEALKGDHNFYRPEVRELWRKSIQHRFAQAERTLPLVYSLGDENALNCEAGFGKSDLESFRSFVQKKYGTIGEYNRKHKSLWKSFDEVPHPPLEESAKNGDFVSWLDHRQYMEQMYADLHHFLREEIRRLDPDALVGAEGSEPGNMELTAKEMDFWGPYNELAGSEALRSLCGGKIRGFWWGGYSPDNPLPEQAKWLVCGTANCSLWFLTVSNDHFAAFCPDGLPAANLQRMLPVLDKLRFGLAQLLIRTPLHEPQILFYWSPVSSAAALLDEKFANPKDGFSVLLPYCFRHALPFEFVSVNTLDRLKNSSAKVLFLCGVSALGEEEARAIRTFAENGGTVIADRNPGIADQDLVLPEKNPLGEMFGGHRFAAMAAPVLADGIELKSRAGNRFRAAKAQILPGYPLWDEKECGKGKTVCANFGFGIASSGAAGAEAFDTFLTAELAAAGVRAPGILSGAQKDPIIRFRKGADHDIAAVWLSLPDVGKKISLTLPDKAYLYDLMEGTETFGSRIEWQDPGSALRIIGIFPEKQNPPPVKAEKTPVKRGGSLLLDLTGVPRDRILSFRVFAPDGSELKTRNFVFSRDRGDSVPIHTAADDEPGDYRVRISDTATSLFTELTFTLTGDAE